MLVKTSFFTTFKTRCGIMSSMTLENVENLTVRQVKQLIDDILLNSESLYGIDSSYRDYNQSFTLRLEKLSKNAIDFEHIEHVMKLYKDNNYDVEFNSIHSRIEIPDGSFIVYKQTVSITVKPKFEFGSIIYKERKEELEEFFKDNEFFTLGSVIYDKEEDVYCLEFNYDFNPKNGVLLKHVLNTVKSLDYSRYRVINDTKLNFGTYDNGFHFLTLELVLERI